MRTLLLSLPLLLLPTLLAAQQSGGRSDFPQPMPSSPRGGDSSGGQQPGGFDPGVSSLDFIDNPNYRLNLNDRIEVTIYQEPDLGVVQRIDSEGVIRFPLIDALRVVGLTIREAEQLIERSYVEQRILRNPMVTIRVIAYSAKDISIFGAVSRPGKFQFPVETESLDIVEVIARVGGFTPIARSNRVVVSRILPNGDEMREEVDVDQMIRHRGRRGETPTFDVKPGDFIWVPERLF